MHPEEEDLAGMISYASEPMTEETEAPTSPRGLCSECAAPLLQTQTVPASWSFAITLVSEISKTFREKSISVINRVCRQSSDPPDSADAADSVGANLGHAFVGRLCWLVDLHVFSIVPWLAASRTWWEVGRRQWHRTFLKFSKGGLPFGALCCSFYVAASMNFSSLQAISSGCVDAAWNAPGCKI